MFYFNYCSIDTEYYYLHSKYMRHVLYQKFWLVWIQLCLCKLDNSVTSHSSEFRDSAELNSTAIQQLNKWLRPIFNCKHSLADLTYDVTTRHLGQHLFAIMPPFDLSALEEVSKQCRMDSKQFMQDLRDFKLWALRSMKISDFHRIKS